MAVAAIVGGLLSGLLMFNIARVWAFIRPSVAEQSGKLWALLNLICDKTIKGSHRVVRIASSL